MILGMDRYGSGDMDKQETAARNRPLPSHRFFQRILDRLSWTVSGICQDYCYWQILLGLHAYGFAESLHCELVNRDRASTGVSLLVGPPPEWNHSRERHRGHRGPAGDDGVFSNDARSHHVIPLNCSKRNKGAAYMTMSIRVMKSQKSQDPQTQSYKA